LIAISNGWRIVNAGSVGVPTKVAPAPTGRCSAPEMELRRTEYDLERAVAELRTIGFPDLDEMLVESLLHPTDPDRVADFFERQASNAS